MGQPVRRTLRTATPTPADLGGRRSALIVSQPGIQALCLLACLVALGWHARHDAAVLRIDVRLDPPPSSAARTRPAAPPHDSQAQTARAVQPRPATARRWAAAQPRRQAAVPRVGSATPGAAPARKASAHPAAAPTRRDGGAHAQTPSVARPPLSRHQARTTAARRGAAAGTPRVRALPLATIVRPASPARRATSPLLPPVSTSGDQERGALAPNPDGRIVALPSVGVAVIRAELRRYRSPLLAATWADGKDAAQYIWDAGRVLHIDPAVLLAFFWHESRYGTAGVARLTFSVGNIRPLAGQPELDGYRFYRTWQESVDDTYRLLRHYTRTGIADVAAALPIWAPPADNNDVAAYVADVQATMSRYYALSTPAQTAQHQGAELVAATP